MIAIDAADGRPIYIQIMDEIRRGIVLGTWRDDEPLPSVRQLAVELRVNPNTVAQAYRELEREGVIYMRRGQGSFVAARSEPDADRAALLRDLARRMLQEAYRYGFAAEELARALERESGHSNGKA
ncbi:MAG TPA: GntR family transcriptional regulator [Longimicrobiales bacterium]|nr:GntR family transcriptional regulator [Longimicrobiales bacterium]